MFVLKTEIKTEKKDRNKAFANKRKNKQKFYQQIICNTREN